MTFGYAVRYPLESTSTTTVRPSMLAPRLAMVGFLTLNALPRYLACNQLRHGDTDEQRYDRTITFALEGTRMSDARRAFA